jgi:hypothetical protein
MLWFAFVCPDEVVIFYAFKVMHLPWQPHRLPPKISTKTHVFDHKIESRGKCSSKRPYASELSRAIFTSSELIDKSTNSVKLSVVPRNTISSHRCCHLKPRNREFETAFCCPYFSVFSKLFQDSKPSNIHFCCICTRKWEFIRDFPPRMPRNGTCAN